MASVSQISSIAKKVYGESDKRVKELERMYNATELQIEGIISRFISDDNTGRQMLQNG